MIMPTSDNQDKPPQASASSPQNVLVKVEKGLGWLTLNRPQALNALSGEMVQTLSQTLTDWQKDPAVSAVVISSSSDKAFCAGGDVRLVYQSRMDNGADHQAMVAPFFLSEYTLKGLLARYPKPVVALMNGITMGGGMGLAMHLPYRVVGDQATLSMPETALGYFPDVGAAYFFQFCRGLRGPVGNGAPSVPPNSAPGASGVQPPLPPAEETSPNLGLFLGLTGWRLTPHQAMATGMATHYVPDDRWHDMVQRLSCEGISLDSDGGVQGQLEAIVSRFAEPDISSMPGAAADELRQNFAAIERIMSIEPVEVMMDTFNAMGTPFSTKVLASLSAASPTSLKVWAAYYRRSIGRCLQDILASDYDLSQKFVQGHDFYEGIRAILIDKDHQPSWRPPVLEGVSDALVQSYFVP